MKLKEFEAKQLFVASEVPCSEGVLIKSETDIPLFSGSKVFKVQTVANGRGKAGGIFLVQNTSQAKEKANEFLGKEFLGEKITEILLDEEAMIEKELYLGILFNTSKRVPVFIFSEQGGIDIEELQNRSPEKIKVRELNILKGLTEEDCDALVKDAKLDEDKKSELKTIMRKLWNCFTKFDCKMLEVNPLVFTEEKEFLAVDAVVVLDDDANFRRGIKFPERTDNRKATAREIAAHEIDKDDHRGVAGKTFLDLDGNIGILTSGGGASMTLMDALIEFGGKPANFTEYSGNPPKEKVERLTRIVLQKEDLTGLLVAGVIANFTNIKETLEGIVDVLKELKPDFPIVIRRAGPHDEEAKIMLEEVKESHGLDIHYYDEKTPLTKAVEIMVELSNKYKVAQ